MADKSGKISRDYAEAQIKLAGYRIYSPETAQWHPNFLTSPGSPCSGKYVLRRVLPVLRQWLRHPRLHVIKVVEIRDRPLSIPMGQFPLLEAFEVIEEYTVPPSNGAIVIFGRVVGDSFDPRVEGDNF